MKIHGRKISANDTVSLGALQLGRTHLLRLDSVPSEVRLSMANGCRHSLSITHEDKSVWVHIHPTQIGFLSITCDFEDGVFFVEAEVTNQPPGSRRQVHRGGVIPSVTFKEKLDEEEGDGSGGADEHPCGV